jgi:hypothetical protein
MIAAMAPLQAFQAGVETALLFVQQTIEEHHGRLLIILWMLLRLPSGPLLLPPPALAGAIKIAALALPAVEPALLIRVKLRFRPQAARGFSLRSTQEQRVFVLDQPDHRLSLGNLQRLRQDYRQIQVIGTVGGPLHLLHSDLTTRRFLFFSHI